MSAYLELAATSNFSFLEGGSHPRELVETAAALGLRGLGLCDRNSFAGVVRAHVATREVRKTCPGFRFIVSTRLVFRDGTPDILAYPVDRDAYGRLCALLTLGNRRAQKGECHLDFDDLAGFADGQLFVLMPDTARFEETGRALLALAALAPDCVWLGAQYRHDHGDRARLNRLDDLARHAGVALLALNDVLYHVPERRRLQDVLTCIREHLTVFTAGRRLEKNAERHLKPATEMSRLFRDHPHAVAETQRLAGRIGFSLDELRYNYPEETIGNGETALQTLQRLTWEGARKRYPAGIPFKIKRGIVTELKLIEQKRYAAYFLTVHDLVRFAREERGILCQGRGSAANSTVCFCLGVTEVDPMVGNLVFGRFLSTERDEPPDIDVDFEHERREEVIQYLYQKYGRERAALTATVITYRSRSALREVGKAFALSEDTIAALNSMSWGSHGREIRTGHLAELGLDLADPTLLQVLALAQELMGFPRHLSQHVGGFVLTRDRLDHCIPISNAAMQDRTVVEWDKDDLDALGILKVDALALGMLTCIHRAFDLMRDHYGLSLTLAGVMQDQDDRIYKMTHRADTVGVFQIESRAQMSMLPRLKPREFYDLVIEVAIVRPGPIQGGMVHPYLKRRQGIESPEEVGPELHAVLKRTLGIPLFQEQAMQIAIVAGGFTPGEADRLRRAMATFRRSGTIGEFRDKLVVGMLARGYHLDFAERCFKQIEGFADYGFPESHAASFALLVYVSCWLKCHYPDVFCCALLNSQPMGFYAPAQLVRDAREHGVEVREVDVNFSGVGAELETGPCAADRVWERHAEMRRDIRSNRAVRLGLTSIKGMKREQAELLAAQRGKGYDSVRDLWLRTRLPVATLERLAGADAFRSIGLDRRAALWAVRGLNGSHGAETLPLFEAAGRPGPEEIEEAGLPPMPLGEHVIHDYRTLSLSLKAHPVQFFRDDLRAQNIRAAAEIAEIGNNRLVETAGLVLVRQRPGTASGVIFMTLEDETGVANIIVWPKIFERFRRVVLGSRFVAVRGVVQQEGLVVHVIARQVADLTASLAALADGEGLPSTPPPRADESRRPIPDHRVAHRITRQEAHARTAHIALPKGRNFH
ncbi:MAG TPA: error-prone DNA polymerase [Devosiaceae bacterium]|nr:error-prone DNA polymerase [Devosiaceae bacterium]